MTGSSLLLPDVGHSSKHVGLQIHKCFSHWQVLHLHRELLQLTHVHLTFSTSLVGCLVTMFSSVDISVSLMSVNVKEADMSHGTLIEQLISYVVIIIHFLTKSCKFTEFENGLHYSD